MNAVRTCVGCRQRSERKALLRVVVRQGELTFDPLASLPGRGAWVHPSKECVQLANDRGAFARAMRLKVSGLVLHKEQAEMMLAKNE
ncbi:MAG: YlxR family protein [Micrococcales bacterium]